MDYVSVILFYVAVILIVIFIVKTVRKRKENKEESKRHPKTDSQKELVREVIAAIERDVPNFYGATVYSSNHSNSGLVRYCSMGAGNSANSEYDYNFNAHGYFVSNEMAYILACQIADHFGGACYEGGTTSFYVAGSRRIASDLEQKRREELERQRIKNLKHL